MGGDSVSFEEGRRVVLGEERGWKSVVKRRLVEVLLVGVSKVVTGGFVGLVRIVVREGRGEGGAKGDGEEARFVSVEIQGWLTTRFLLHSTRRLLHSEISSARNCPS